MSTHPTEVVKAAAVIHEDLLSYLKMTVKVNDDGKVIPPANLHGKLDIISSYKMKNSIPLSSREVTYIWDRLIFRVVQSLYHGPPKTIDETHHFLAIGILAFSLVGSTFINQTRAEIIGRIINYVDDILYDMGFPGFSAGRYVDDKMDYFRQFSRTIVDTLVG